MPRGIYKRSPEFIKSLSDSLKKRTGKSSIHWKGGISKDSDYKKKYDLKHRDEINARVRIWRGNNSEKAKLYTRLRIYKRKGAGGSFNLKEWNRLKEYYGFKCPCCGKKEPNIKLTADHIIPISLGGSSYIFNIQPLCLSCNSSKGSKSIFYKFN